MWVLIKEPNGNSWKQRVRFEKKWNKLQRLAHHCSLWYRMKKIGIQKSHQELMETGWKKKVRRYDKQGESSEIWARKNSPSSWDRAGTSRLRNYATDTNVVPTKKNSEELIRCLKDVCFEDEYHFDIRHKYGFSIMQKLYNTEQGRASNSGSKTEGIILTKQWTAKNRTSIAVPLRV